MISSMSGACLQLQPFIQMQAKIVYQLQKITEVRESKVHKHCIYIQTKWVGALCYSSMLRYIIYKAAMLVHSQIRISMLKNIALHCIVSTLWWNRLVFLKCQWQYSMRPMCRLKLSVCPKMCIYCNFKVKCCFSQHALERAVLMLRWYSNKLSQTVLRRDKNPLSAVCWCELWCISLQISTGCSPQKGQDLLSWGKYESNLIFLQKTNHQFEHFSFLMTFQIVLNPKHN